MWTYLVCYTQPQEPVPQVGDPIHDQEQVKKRKIDKNFTNWLYGYSIYMTILLQVQPAKAQALIKYQDIIHRAFREHTGSACLNYNKHFRLIMNYNEQSGAR